RVREIALAPLEARDLAELLADALHCDATHALPLAELVHEKTAGNPFFANHFIHALADERLIVFDPAVASWSWDVRPIHVTGYTDNVVDLMVGKLGRLPETTREVLKELACLGNAAETAALETIRDASADDIHDALWEALCLELIVRSGDS